MLNILVVGVGGQGVLTLAKLIARAAFKQGFDVKMSETHGLSQREGVIRCTVRIGEKVHSSLFNEADLIIALEPLEAMRASNYATEKTKFVINSHKIIPPSVELKLAKYPDVPKNSVEALRIVTEMGASFALNTYMLGLASKYLPVEEKYLLAEVSKLKKADINRKAFELARE